MSISSLLDSMTGGVAPPRSWRRLWRCTLPSRDNASVDEEELKRFRGALARRSASLELDNNRGCLPTGDEAYVHLELLYAFARLRQTAGDQDGLFDLWDEDVLAGLAMRQGQSPVSAESLQAVMAEKRWSLYVARAESRFAFWWASLRRDTKAGSLSLETFSHPSTSYKWLDWIDGRGKRLILTRDTLPPLDILMVWHSFMLNPRCYLEDSLRQDMMCLWHTGMPWTAIHASFDASTGTYDPGEEAVEHFEALRLGDDDAAGLKWSNLDDPASKAVACGLCHEYTACHWSDTSRESVRLWAATTETADQFPSGTGLADTGFLRQCRTRGCPTVLTNDQLRLDRFNRDCRRFSAVDQSASVTKTNDAPGDAPMPGTLLARNGLMESAHDPQDPRIVANGVLAKVLCQDFSGKEQSLRAIRETANVGLAQLADAQGLGPSARARLSAVIDRVFSRYEETPYDFSLDLAAAVGRQGVFVSKMARIDWLHSPAAIATTARLAGKYSRFFGVMASRIGAVTVPTLDVDLLWHTNQLSPSRYYGLCLASTVPPHFIDHDDRIGQGELDDAFAQTTKIYEERYGEPYSECSCWNCEAVRAWCDPAIISMLGLAVDATFPTERRSLKGLFGKRGSRRSHGDSSHPVT